MLFAFLAAAAAAAVVAAPPLPQAKPIDIATWFSGDDYPAEAVKAGAEGDVTFEADVDATGKPTACRIAKSSGSALLDQKTCEIVMTKGRFKPAMAGGKPVPGRFSKSTSWRLEEPTAIPPSGYFAAIVDFSKDPAHPTCRFVGMSLGKGADCGRLIDMMHVEGAGEKLTKMVSLVSVTKDGEKPHQGEADWGRRVAFVAYDLYAPRNGKPACMVVAHEGLDPTGGPCGQMADASTLSEADRKSAQRTHIEQSLFAVFRPGEPTAGKCKNGESEAEAQGCG